MWNERFINLCKHVSQWSKDPSTKVGAVIADSKNRVVSLGFNGLPRGVQDTDERLTDRVLKYPRIVHAEVNAILNANGSVEGCTLYVFPLTPCSECAKVIIQAGIKKVIYRLYGSSAKWDESFLIAKEMFDEAKVKVEEF
jgi:dCMP deaminase